MGLEDRLLEGSKSNNAVVMINDATFFFDFLRKKKKCAVRRHTQNWVKRPAHAEKLECQKCSLSLAGSAFDPLPALYYKTATYLFLLR